MTGLVALIRRQRDQIPLCLCLSPLCHWVSLQWESGHPPPKKRAVSRHQPCQHSNLIFDFQSTELLFRHRPPTPPQSMVFCDGSPSRLRQCPCSVEAEGRHVGSKAATWLLFLQPAPSETVVSNPLPWQLTGNTCKEQGTGACSPCVTVNRPCTQMLGDDPQQGLS